MSTSHLSFLGLAFACVVCVVCVVACEKVDPDRGAVLANRACAVVGGFEVGSLYDSPKQAREAVVGAWYVVAQPTRAVWSDRDSSYCPRYTDATSPARCTVRPDGTYRKEEAGVVADGTFGVEPAYADVANPDGTVTQNFLRGYVVVVREPSIFLPEDENGDRLSRGNARVVDGVPVYYVYDVWGRE